MKPIFRRCQNLWGGDSGIHLQWMLFPYPCIFKVEVQQPFVVQPFCWRNALGSLGKRQAHLQEVRLLQRGLQARGNGEMRRGTGIGVRGVLHEFRNGRCVILCHFMVCNFWPPRDREVLTISFFLAGKFLSPRGEHFLAGNLHTHEFLTPLTRNKVNEAVAFGKWWDTHSCFFQPLGVMNILMQKGLVDYVRL